MAFIILVVLQRLKCLMIPLKVLCTKSWHPLSLMGSPVRENEPFLESSFRTSSASVGQKIPAVSLISGQIFLRYKFDHRGIA